jgi:hypothetical protein
MLQQFLSFVCCWATCSRFSRNEKVETRTAFSFERVRLQPCRTLRHSYGFSR